MKFSDSLGPEDSTLVDGDVDRADVMNWIKNKAGAPPLGSLEDLDVTSEQTNVAEELRKLRAGRAGHPTEPPGIDDGVIRRRDPTAEELDVLADVDVSLDIAEALDNLDAPDVEIADFDMDLAASPDDFDIEDADDLFDEPDATRAHDYSLAEILGKPALETLDEESDDGGGSDPTRMFGADERPEDVTLLYDGDDADDADHATMQIGEEEIRAAVASARDSKLKPVLSLDALRASLRGDSSGPAPIPADDFGLGEPHTESESDDDDDDEMVEDHTARIDSSEGDLYEETGPEQMVPDGTMQLRDGDVMPADLTGEDLLLEGATVEINALRRPGRATADERTAEDLNPAKELANAGYPPPGYPQPYPPQRQPQPQQGGYPPSQDPYGSGMPPNPYHSGLNPTPYGYPPHPQQHQHPGPIPTPYPGQYPQYPQGPPPGYPPDYSYGHPQHPHPPQQQQQQPPAPQKSAKRAELILTVLIVVVAAIGAVLVIANYL